MGVLPPAHVITLSLLICSCSSRYKISIVPAVMAGWIAEGAGLKNNFNEKKALESVELVSELYWKDGAV